MVHAGVGASNIKSRPIPKSPPTTMREIAIDLRLAPDGIGNLLSGSASVPEIRTSAAMMDGLSGMVLSVKPGLGIACWLSG
jgi:hypothetical protein